MAGGEQPRGAAPGAPTPATFYDELAAGYHRLYADWDAAIEQQSAAIDALLRRRQRGDGPLRILDCAVGIGTQALGLLARGHHVTGTDVSAGAVARAQAECAQRGLTAELGVADMRSLPFAPGTFDAVVCADNAIAHLPTLVEVALALGELARVTQSGGTVVVSVRDYAAARAEQLPGTLPQLSHRDGLESVAFQAWDWHRDGRCYDLTHFTLSRGGSGWQVATRSSVLQALIEPELVECAQHAGLTDVEWCLPAETGLFQPVLLASVS